MYADAQGDGFPSLKLGAIKVGFQRRLLCQRSRADQSEQTY
jgi:hypothetical protein